MREEGWAATQPWPRQAIDPLAEANALASQKPGFGCAKTSIHLIEVAPSGSLLGAASKTNCPKPTDSV